ncbi:metallophosphoesterase family protein [Candidatus Eisenbacteria bacterium]|uniref:Metallophosphoesterase family protein n=1 Tax=Eiseniibacteriota bacterium TaxID=2212470 RepID=A0ABV6YMG4_UNCEI
MPKPLSSPWLLQFQPTVLEVRLLARTAGDVDGELFWLAESPDRDLGSVEAEISVTADEISLGRLGSDVVLLRFPIVDYEGTGGRYRIRLGDRFTSWLHIPCHPLPGQPWRFLLASDHHCRPAALGTLRAVSRFMSQKPCHGILFSGDMVGIPDDLTSWVGANDGASFLESMAAPVDRIFHPSEQLTEQTARAGWPLLSTAPILACPGNHEVSSDSGDSPQKRFYRITPIDWNLETFSKLFMPVETETGATTAPPGCFVTTMGPLRVLSTFVARRWVPGDHDTQSGPCYQPPGRFIFESIAPDSRQVTWIRRQIADSADQANGERGRSLHIALLHHSPYAQGFNARPSFDDPPAYRTNQIVRSLVPLLEPWADLVLSGHNHAVNHHHIGGVHYFESSHMSIGKPPRMRLPDGTPAPEPLGHPSEFFAAEEGGTFFSVLEVVETDVGFSGGVTCYRVQAGGWAEEEYAFEL